MLINFSVENFRSFGAEQTLNLVASAKLQGHEDHLIPIAQSGKSVLRTSVVYGANAAGKSNLVRAILFAQGLILGASQLRQLALSQFRLAKQRGTSSFEFRFLVHGQVFVYGFDVNQNLVVAEWLEATTPKGKSAEVYSRKGQEISLSGLKAFGKAAEVSRKALEAFLVLKPRPDQLLLNKIVELPSPSRGPLLDPIAWWFTECLTVIQPTRQLYTAPGVSRTGFAICALRRRVPQERRHRHQRAARRRHGDRGRESSERTPREPPGAQGARDNPVLG